MLSHSRLGQEFWTKTFDTACLLANRSSFKVIECRTSFKVWSESCVNYSQLRVFGCPAWVYVWNGQRELRTRPYVFLEYTSRGYMLCCNDEETLGNMINRDVTFNELIS